MAPSALIVALLASGGSVFLLLGGAEELSHLLTIGRARRTLSRLSRTLRGLGRTGALLRLLEVPQARRIVDGLMESVPARAMGLDAPGTLATLLAALLLVCCASSVLFGSAVAGVAVGVALAGTLVARDASVHQRARREVTLAMPGIYRTLSVALGSGQTLAQAVEYVGSHERGPAAGIFARMSLRLRCGMSTEEAVGQLARELGVPGAELLAAALVISHRTGSPLRDLLMRSARLAERQGEFERLLSVKTAQVRLSVKIVCLLPVAMVGILALISPDFQGGLLTPVGMVCLLLAGGLDALALFLIRRLVRVVV